MLDVLGLIQVCLGSYLVLVFQKPDLLKRGDVEIAKSLCLAQKH